MSPRRTSSLRPVAALLSGLAACSLLLTGPRPASAAYAYWSYWHDKSGTGDSYSYSGCGAFYSKGDCVPADGTVEGWHFVIADEGQATPPRSSVSFAQVCGSAKAPSGQKRVAVVIDYADHASSPSGVRAACAQVASGANGYEVLDDVSTPTAGTGDRAGFVCAIDGYPRSGCGEYAGEPSPSPSRSKRPATARPASTAPSRAGDDGSSSGDDPAATGGSSGTSHSSSSLGQGSDRTGGPLTQGPTDASETAPPTRASSTTATQPGTATTEPPVVIGGAEPQPPSSGGGLPLGGVAAVLVAAALGGAAALRARRRGSTG